MQAAGDRSLHRCALEKQYFWVVDAKAVRKPNASSTTSSGASVQPRTHTPHERFSRGTNCSSSAGPKDGTAQPRRIDAGCNTNPISRLLFVIRSEQPTNRATNEPNQISKKKKKTLVREGSTTHPRTPASSLLEQKNNLSYQRVVCTTRLSGPNSEISAARASHTPGQLEEAGVAEILGLHSVFEQHRDHLLGRVLHTEHIGHLRIVPVCGRGGHQIVSARQGTAVERGVHHFAARFGLYRRVKVVGLSIFILSSSEKSSPPPPTQPCDIGQKGVNVARPLSRACVKWSN